MSKDLRYIQLNMDNDPDEDGNDYSLWAELHFGPEPEVLEPPQCVMLGEWHLEDVRYPHFDELQDFESHWKKVAEVLGVPVRKDDFMAQFQGTS